MHAPERRPRVPLLAQLLFATAAGALTGKLLGPRAAWLGDAALVFVDVLKLLATPLVFVAIVETFVTTRLPLKRALVLLPLSALNAIVAAAIAIGLAHLLPLARFVDLPRLRALAPAPSTAHHLPSINLLWVIAAALVCGILLRASARTRAAQEIGRAAAWTLHLLMRLVGVVVRLVPFAVFGVMARVVGGSGLRLFPLLAIFVALVALGMAVHIFVWYALLLRFVARRSPARFLRDASDALVTSLGVGSSLATLPVTLRTLAAAHGGLERVGAPGRRRRHQPEPRRHRALRGGGGAVRGAGLRHHARARRAAQGRRPRRPRRASASPACPRRAW